MQTARVAPRGAAVPSLICLASPRKGQNLGLRKRFLSLGQPNPASVIEFFTSMERAVVPIVGEGISGYLSQTPHAWKTPWSWEGVSQRSICSVGEALDICCVVVPAGADSAVGEMFGVILPFSHAMRMVTLRPKANERQFVFVYAK